MFLTSVASALALTGLSFGLIILNSTVDLFFSKAPFHLLGLNGLIGVKAKISDPIGKIGPCADRL